MTFGTMLSSVAELRLTIFGKGAAVTRDDFFRALAFDANGDAFADLLADIAAEIILEQAEPPRYVTVEDAAWLIGAIHAHPLPYAVEIRMLTQTMGRALSLPDSLSRFLLAEIEAAIVTGRRDHPAGLIDSRDVEALRCAVYATDEGASLHVTRPEAETLFRIAHAGLRIDPAFNDFFAKAVGNHLMGIVHRGGLSRGDRKQLEAFANSPAPSLGEFLGGMFSAVSLPTRDDLDDVSARAGVRLRERDAADSAARAVAERIDEEETAWLVANLSRDGALTSAERALLVFIEGEMAGKPSPALRTLFARAQA